MTKVSKPTVLNLACHCEETDVRREVNKLISVCVVGSLSLFILLLKFIKHASRDFH